jgi:choline dehydrogenase-like flavoprotein
MAEHYDVIIIGSGAGGGTLAHRLSGSGLRVLLLERGGYLPREKANWDTQAVFLDNRYKAQEEWLDAKGKPFHPGTHYNVGGNTKVYGAALLRLRERDFEAVQHFDGVSPAWPIRYGDLADYYTQAEYLYEVHGERGADPTEPPCDMPYPFPKVPHEPRIQQLHDDWVRLGLHPFHVPLGIRLDPRRGHQGSTSPPRGDPQQTKYNLAAAAPMSDATLRNTVLPSSPCIRCNTCDGFPCLLDAKADAQVMCVDPACKRGVELWTEAKVLRLLTGPSGREVTAVEVARGGETLRVRGDVVVVACGAINSAALLLRSANAQHPHGLGNRSGVVGRHYMCHNNSAVLAISRHENGTVFQKTIALNDFYFGADDSPFPLGHISMVGKSDKLLLKAGAPPFAPGFVLDKMAKHAIDFWLTSEDLPDPDNRVTLTGDGQIQLSYAPNNTQAHDRLLAKLKAMMKRIGCEEHTFFDATLYLGKKIPLAGVAHQCGTVRFGDDPATSALDVNCKAHDVDNLYVVDGSFFPSSAAVNPALTIMANALRVGDHLQARLGKVSTAGARS